MVAKFKNSFLKNGFQLFCYKHLLARDVIHNTITAPPNPSATVNDDLKKLSSSSPSLNNPAFAQNRLSKRDKRASTRATAGRSASLNIKPPSVTSPNKNGYVMIDASSNEEQPADQEEITVNGLIKSSKSHPNFTVTTHNSSPVKDAANNELDPNSRLSTKSSPTSNSDLMVVSDFAAENHSNSSELSSTAGSSGSTSSPSEDSISNKRQSKSINNNNASVYNSGQILSKSSSMHHQAPNANSEIKKTYLPNGAVLIDPPSINRAVNLNRYSMPIIQSPSKDLIHSDTQLDENPLYGNRNSSDFVQLNKNVGIFRPYIIVYLIFCHFFSILCIRIHKQNSHEKQRSIIALNSTITIIIHCVPTPLLCRQRAVLLIKCTHPCLNNNNNNLKSRSIVQILSTTIPNSTISLHQFRPLFIPSDL